MKKRDPFWATQTWKGETSRQAVEYSGGLAKKVFYSFFWDVRSPGDNKEEEKEDNLKLPLGEFEECTCKQRKGVPDESI